MRASAIYTPLRRRGEFTRVFASGLRKGDELIQVRAARREAREGQAPIRLGITVGRKYGSAVERNRFKRIVRAAIRELGPELSPGWDVLVLPRAAHAATSTQMRETLRRLLGALGVLTGTAEGGPP